MNLKETHDAVKNHPYRLANDEKYLKSYRDLLYSLSHKLVVELKEDKLLFRAVMIMNHDFNGAIFNNNTEHIERCLGVVHRFIDTGEIPEVYSYYTGGNNNPCLDRLRKFVLDPEWDGGYRPVFTKEEIVRGLDYIFYWRKKHPEIKNLDWTPYSDYWIELLEKCWKYI